MSEIPIFKQSKTINNRADGKGAAVKITDLTLPGRFWKFRYLYLMFLPAFVYFIMFSYYPFFKGILMSFQENKLMGARPFAGLENYTYVLKDPDYIQAVINSLIIGLADMVLYFGLSLVLALCINEVGLRPVQKGLRTITYLPYLFSWSVIGGIWALAFNNQGIVNIVRGWFGAEPLFFLAEAKYARMLVISMGVWRSIGYFAMLYSVSIFAIDPSLYEAARIDGAGRFMQITRIIIPSLAGTMKVILVILSISVLTHFDEIYVMQNPGNRRSIQTLLIYVYEVGITNFKWGTATAGATLVMAGTLVLAFITRNVIKYDA